MSTGEQQREASVNDWQDDPPSWLSVHESAAWDELRARIGMPLPLDAVTALVAAAREKGRREQRAAFVNAENLT
jgi:hypothetical protein